ncbi:hypothetical protein BOTBODRAFT_50484 [Botryobasidium botryosum FD-172 SS1]|uniref:Uncharacterized protein n=1 Tax=Botryobasidium botryosum (strain FD-172 SS1) TaxID=930990 RepID=A0A067N0C4_BOTB1|nr:hypothetical protein BOTBODRAFT_50484 [Botryobasidium botryosum FD-172 SS1]
MGRPIHSLTERITQEYPEPRAAHVCTFSPCSDVSCPHSGNSSVEAESSTSATSTALVQEEAVNPISVGQISLSEPPSLVPVLHPRASSTPEEPLGNSSTLSPLPASSLLQNITQEVGQITEQAARIRDRIRSMRGVPPASHTNSATATAPHSSESPPIAIPPLVNPFDALPRGLSPDLGDMSSPLGAVWTDTSRALDAVQARLRAAIERVRAAAPENANERDPNQNVGPRHSAILLGMSMPPLTVGGRSESPDVNMGGEEGAPPPPLFDFYSPEELALARRWPHSSAFSFYGRRPSSTASQSQPPVDSLFSPRPGWRPAPWSTLAASRERDRDTTDASTSLARRVIARARSRRDENPSAPSQASSAATSQDRSHPPPLVLHRFNIVIPNPDSSEGRTYRIRRRLNADGEEHVHRIYMHDGEPVPDRTTPGPASDQPRSEGMAGVAPGGTRGEREPSTTIRIRHLAASTRGRPSAIPPLMPASTPPPATSATQRVAPASGAASPDPTTAETTFDSPASGGSLPWFLSSVSELQQSHNDMAGIFREGQSIMDNLITRRSGGFVSSSGVGGRRRRGWARIDANGEEIPTDEEEEATRNERATRARTARGRSSRNSLNSQLFSIFPPPPPQPASVPASRSTPESFDEILDRGFTNNFENYLQERIDFGPTPGSGGDSPFVFGVHGPARANFAAEARAAAMRASMSLFGDSPVAGGWRALPTSNNSTSGSQPGSNTNDGVYPQPTTVVSETMDGNGNEEDKGMAEEVHPQYWAPQANGNTGFFSPTIIRGQDAGFGWSTSSGRGSEVGRRGYVNPLPMPLDEMVRGSAGRTMRGSSSGLRSGTVRTRRFKRTGPLIGR